MRKTVVIFFLGKQTIMSLQHPFSMLILEALSISRAADIFTDHRLKDLSLSSDRFENPASLAHEKWLSVPVLCAQGSLKRYLF